MFPAGTNGHFLGNFLLPTVNVVAPNFRIDWKQSATPLKFIGSKFKTEAHETDFLQSLDTWVSHNTHGTVISHYRNISKIIKYNNSECWVRKIMPTVNIIGYCKNVFFKKHQLENVDSSELPMSDQIDGMLMNIADFYHQHNHDKDRPAEYIVNFDKLTDVQYLTALYEQVNGIPPDAAKLEWANQYISQQFAPILYCSSKNMEDIINQVNPQDMFDIAACLFMFENNWDSIDKNRLWTIDDFPATVDQAKKFLIAAGNNYTFTKGQNFA